MEWTAKIFCTVRTFFSQYELFYRMRFLWDQSLSSKFLSHPIFPIVHPNVSLWHQSLFIQMFTNHLGHYAINYLVNGVRSIARWQSLHVNWIICFELILCLVVTNIAGFLANPNFPNGYGEDPRKLHTESPEKYREKVKMLSKLSTWTW